MWLKIRSMLCLCSSAQCGLRLSQFFVFLGAMWLELQKWTIIHAGESASSDTGNGHYWAIFMVTKVLRVTREMDNIGQYSC